MSVRLMTIVWQSQCQSHTEKLVLLALADNANDEGDCWPSIKTIATKCNLSERCVFEQIKQLQANSKIGLLQSGGGRTNNRYRLFLAPLNTVQGVNSVHTSYASDSSTYIDEPSLNHHVPPLPPKRGKSKKTTVPWTDEQRRLGAIFRRRPESRWSHDEIEAWKNITPVATEDFEVLERYYKARLPSGVNDYRRTSLLTLLRYFQGEVDRARNFKLPSAL